MADVYSISGREVLLGRGVNEGVVYGSEVHTLWDGPEYPADETLANVREWAAEDQGVIFVESEVGVAMMTVAVTVEREAYVLKSKTRLGGLFSKVVSMTRLSEDPQPDQAVYPEPA